MPDPTPPKSNEPAPAAPTPPPTPPPAPPADPPPAPPTDPPKPSFRPLEDDLADIGKPPAAPAKPEDPPKPPEDPPAAPPAEPPAEPPKPPEDPEDDYLGVPKPKDEPKPPGKTEDPPAAPLKAPELRAEYAKVKQRLADAEKELGSYKSGGKPLEGDEKKAYLEEISGLKKQLEEASGSLKAVAYEQSDEYKQKYEKPFVDAWQEGVSLVEGLTVQDAEGNPRKGTAQDFEAIMAEPDNERAANMAQENFGVNAVYVLTQRRDIHKLHNQRVRVLEEFRATLSEREKQQMETHKQKTEEREAQRLQNVTLFKRFNAEAAEKHPELFAPIDGDEEGNALLAKGYQQADMAFGAGGQDMPAERRVRLHSAIRNRAAAFSRLVHQLKGKDAEIAAIKAELDEIKGSTPGEGEPTSRGEDGKFRRPSADEEFEALAKNQ